MNGSFEVFEKATKAMIASNVPFWYSRRGEEDIGRRTRTPEYLYFEPSGELRERGRHLCAHSGFGKAHHIAVMKF
jgi:hypothetical protein